MNSTSQLINTQWSEFLTQLSEDWGKFQQNTLKNYIMRGAEIIERMINNKILDLDLSNISSYLYTELNKIGLEVSDRWIQKVLPANYKQNYSQSEHPSEYIEPIWETISTKGDLIEKNQFGQYKINNHLQQDKIVKPKTLSEESVDERPKNKYTDLLNLISDSASKLQVTADAIIQRFEDNSQLVIEGLQPFKENQKKYADYYAKIANSKDVLDDRNKWGDYEKIMAKFLMDSGETIAHIAKLMDYSSKFGSIGILNNEDLQNKVHQLGMCPSCNADIYYTMNEKLKQLEIHAQFEI